MIRGRIGGELIHQKFVLTKRGDDPWVSPRTFSKPRFLISKLIDFLACNHFSISNWK